MNLKKSVTWTLLKEKDGCVINLVFAEAVKNLSGVAGLHTATERLVYNDEEQDV